VTTRMGKKSEYPRKAGWSKADFADTVDQGGKAGGKVDYLTAEMKKRRRTPPSTCNHMHPDVSFTDIEQQRREIKIYLIRALCRYDLDFTGDEQQFQVILK
jgi:hypothetical protein